VGLNPQLHSVGRSEQESAMEERSAPAWLTVSEKVVVPPLATVADVCVVVNEILLTPCARAADVLAAKLASPKYSAVIEWLPPDNALELNEAAPLAFKDAKPTMVLPSRILTSPVAPAGVTVAVNLAGWPELDGFGEELNEVAVGCEPVTGLIFAANPSPDMRSAPGVDGNVLPAVPITYALPPASTTIPAPESSKPPPR